MANYIKITDFAAKDNLLTGNPAKLVKGSEIGADFDAVAVAVATKANTADKLSVFAATTSAELKGVISDETGSGALVFADTPTLVTPNLGVATATSINKLTITAPATSATLTVANGKTLTASNTLTLAGTDGTTLTFQGTDTYVGRATTDTLTNKSISGSTNTLSNIGNAALTNSSLTIGSTSVSLGGTAATVAGLTLTSPTINGTIGTTGLTLPAFTLGGTVTSNGQSFSGTIANLGTVTTVDINGGTIDGLSTFSTGTGTTTNAGLKIVNGSAGVASGWAGIYAENLTPSTTNYSFATNYQGTSTVVNGGTALTLQVGASSIAALTSTGLAVTGTLSATGLTLDSSGNLGLGVTPSAWTVFKKVLESESLSLCNGSNAGQEGRLFQNIYYDGSYRYKWGTYAGAHLALTNGGLNIVSYTGNLGAGLVPTTLTTILALEKDKSLALQGATSQTGAGITFPASQSASSDANTLDDYEEGTFTPTIVGTGTAGTGTYTAQVGRYTKIGNRVFVTLRITWTAHTGTGNMRVGGLPFTQINVANARSSYTAIAESIALAAANVFAGALGIDNTATIDLFQQTNTGGGAVSNITLDTAGTISITGHYEV